MPITPPGYQPQTQREWANFFQNADVEANRAGIYTVATLPNAAGNTRLAIVTNEAGGATLAFSDGTNWRRVQDRAIVS